MGKHEYKGVRAQRAMAMALARREEKQRIKNLKYGVTSDPATDHMADFYPRRPISARPGSARPGTAGRSRPGSAGSVSSSTNGLAMDRTEAASRGLVLTSAEEEKKKVTVRAQSMKNMKTCVGVLALGLIGAGLLVGVTGQWLNSNSGKIGIGCIVAGVGIIIAIFLFTYIRYKHGKMKAAREEQKKVRAATAIDMEIGNVRPTPRRAETRQGVRPGTAKAKAKAKLVMEKEGKEAQSIQMRPMSSSKREREGTRSRTKSESDEEKEYKKQIAVIAVPEDKELIVSRSSSRSSLRSTLSASMSDKEPIVSRSSSRASMNLQGSINMSAIPEDEEAVIPPVKTTPREGEEEKENDVEPKEEDMPGLVVTTTT